MQSKVKITVKGLVQGVGYRYFCYRKAIEYDICGYAKNLFDGSVEVVAAGNEKFLNDFAGELKKGPPNSFVKAITLEEITPDMRELYDKEFKSFKML
jgi:acylphosphatase